jgi:hypothetical protein
MRSSRSSRCCSPSASKANDTRESFPLCDRTATIVAPVSMQRPPMTRTLARTRSPERTARDSRTAQPLALRSTVSARSVQPSPASSTWQARAMRADARFVCPAPRVRFWDSTTAASTWPRSAR